MKRQWFDQLCGAERLFAEFFDGSNVGLAIFDEQGRYQMINPYLAASHRASPESHLGKQIREVLGEVALHVEPAFQRVFSSAEPIFNLEVAGALPTRRERGRWLDNFFPISDSSGKVVQVGAVVVELGPHVRLQQPDPNSVSQCPVLRTWKDIAHYLGTCVKTVQRWERSYEMPVRRVHPGKGSVVLAYKEEVDEWLRTRARDAKTSSGNAPVSSVHHTPFYTGMKRKRDRG